MSAGEQRPRPVQAVAEQHKARFRTRTGRAGSTGPLRSRGLACRVQTAWHGPHGEEPGAPLGLLLEWPRKEAEPTQYSRGDWPQELCRKPRVASARGRWRAERDDQPRQQERGLDQGAGRCWTGWHHHVTVVMSAIYFCAGSSSGSRGHARWTLPQARRERPAMHCTWTGCHLYCGAEARSP